MPRSALWYDDHIGGREGSARSWAEAHTSAADAAERCFKH